MEFHNILRRRCGGQPMYPQLRTLKVGQSIDLPIRTKKPHLSYYDMAKKAGIRVSVRTLDPETVRVTRIE